MIEDLKRCDNLACLCNVAITTSVCDPYCDSVDARDSTIITCKCGHSTCTTVIEKQLHAGDERALL